MSDREAVRKCMTMGARVDFYRGIVEITLHRAGRKFTAFAGDLPTATQKIIDKLNNNEYEGA